MLKHVGRHADRKVAIIFREIPGNEHMCLVVYPDLLPTPIHDTLMRVIESPVGQQATNLADALHRNLLPDGRPVLETLHKEGMLKKVSANQVVVTPTPSSAVKLDELNRLVKEMESGEDARRRMEELDTNSGLVDPAVKRDQEREFKRRRLEEEAARARQGLPQANETALDDKSLAANLVSQAKRMEQEARGMIAEAARMKKEAERMFPGVVPAEPTEPVTAPVAEKKSTRKPRVAQAVDANAVQ